MVATVTIESLSVVERVVTALCGADVFINPGLKRVFGVLRRCGGVNDPPGVGVDDAIVTGCRVGFNTVAITHLLRPIVVLIRDPGC